MAVAKGTPSGSRRSKASAKRGATRTRSSGGAKAQKPAAKKAAAESDQLSDGKLYYRIGEVAKITDVKPHVLRYWETEFRWMAPPKSRSKQRLYRRKDIDMILLIKKLLYDERYTIAGARQRLRELGLAKALEGANDAEQVATTAQASDEASNVESRAVAVSELRSGYRRIRRELQALRDVL